MDLSNAVWRKSIHSGQNDGDCVEVASLPGAIAVRDSKNPRGPVLAFSPGAWRGFTEAMKSR
ncbi:DUF397 domain-containing protein [Actinomadura scrupuli]|uniref:DUF397 domain-containing protein n=1 Tax=Actinomadura scrupuli TaxID=559629 RepID=UPI003D975392